MNLIGHEAQGFPLHIGTHKGLPTSFTVAMSRFVSSGTISSTGGETAKPATESKGDLNPEWERVQKELEAERAKRSEARRKAVEGEEKSLYDILQANKAAKQAEFEEQNKIRNQFKALDDDDVEFLDEVREKKKREEEALRKETEEGLRAFRERQKDGGDRGESQDKSKDEADEVTWGPGRKRKRSKDKEGAVKGLKRKTSQSTDGHSNAYRGDGEEAQSQAEPPTSEDAKVAPAKKPAIGGLVAYGSDDSD